MRLIVSRETGEILDVLEPASAADYAAFHQLLADQVRREILRIGRDYLDGICRKARVHQHLCGLHISAFYWQTVRDESELCDR